jgi:hypothetical protein
MAVDATISAVPRSGQPDDPKNSVTPELSPVSPFSAPGLGLGGSDASSGGLAMVEAISGSKRELTAVVTK